MPLKKKIGYVQNLLNYEWQPTLTERRGKGHCKVAFVLEPGLLRFKMIKLKIKSERYKMKKKRLQYPHNLF